MNPKSWAYINKTQIALSARFPLLPQALCARMDRPHIKLFNLLLSGVIGLEFPTGLYFLLLEMNAHKKFLASASGTTNLTDI